VIATFVYALCALLALIHWVAPWHVPALAFGRLRWTDARGRACVCTFVLVSGGTVAWNIATGRLLAPSTLVCFTYAASAGYDLWRAWRDHRPPRRPVRDRVRDVVQRPADRMQPPREPLPLVVAR
jgi:hypothetical protein